jgi:geranylgeranyl reductase family protein
MQKFDVVICGAGPAGITAALAMGKSGLKVAMLDKAVFPRDKTCGDAIAPYIPKVLATIDPSYAVAFENFNKKTVVNKCRIVAPNEKILDIKYPENGYISKRMDFDNFLFGLTSGLPNLTVFENTMVKDVQVTDAYVTIYTNAELIIEAKIILGCDGANSVTNKKLTAVKTVLNHHSGAVRAYYSNVSGIAAGTFELHFIKDISPGYFWIFPLADNMVNVGLGMLSSQVSAKKINLRQEMHRIIETNAYIKERFKNATLTSEIKGFGLPLGSRKVQISGNRFMLCGDAASLIDPVTGEGIGQAMVSGRYAGWQAIECFKQNNFTAAFIKEYDKKLYDKFWKRHRNSSAIQKLIHYCPWSLNLAANMASKSKYIHAIIEKYIV